MEYHYLQNDFYLENVRNQMVVTLLFCLALLLIQILLLMLLRFFLSKSTLITNTAIADLSNNPFCFIIASSV